MQLRRVLRALRDRLPPEEASHLASELPMLLEGVFYEGWRPASTPVRIRDRREFLDGMREPLRSRVPNPGPGADGPSMKVVPLDGGKTRC